jgi:hypothetical protein
MFYDQDSAGEQNYSTFAPGTPNRSIQFEIDIQREFIRSTISNWLD